jgi:hypothetical protein
MKNLLEAYIGGNMVSEMEGVSVTGDLSDSYAETAHSSGSDGRFTIIRVCSRQTKHFARIAGPFHLPESARSFREERIRARGAANRFANRWESR